MPPAGRIRHHYDEWHIELSVQRGDTGKLRRTTQPAPQRHHDRAERVLAGQSQQFLAQAIREPEKGSVPAIKP